MRRDEKYLVPERVWDAVTTLIATHFNSRSAKEATMGETKEASKFDDGGPGNNMTALDYFAGQALAGSLANVDYLPKREAGECIEAAIARDVYNQAAAMVAEKRKREAGGGA